ncbi:Oxygen-dependent coproporphyrinogen-III oxidase [Seminavis robusta]|uniref:Oxygen-dependent coproporphyrinogen-III oxidase n=1 Tax=Seminavis robusta TaxID=568900 RepID=A0A9N8HVM6_9STRA|nr:Oxygen-dependent coproporphyrinogen-III oxidase [Seminavis robusta]|eukprot:Sro1836_g300630.1 Oxygen-dependent coproporphyrinogen-III oxidase (389) ;mRNA; f:491-1791
MMAAAVLVRIIGLLSLVSLLASARAFTPVALLRTRGGGCHQDSSLDQSTTPEVPKEELEIFERFSNFLQAKQREIIAQIEEIDGSGQTFSKNTWGIFDTDSDDLPKVGAGGITRVIQGGNVVEKGACSLTIIQNGVLSAERAAAIRARQPKDDDDDDEDDDFLIGSGDFYSAAALSIVLHSRSPMVPTFRSDVRIFLVQDVSSKERTRPVMAWFGGGADLTPYYLIEEDIRFFHNKYKEVCESYGQSYPDMKKCCDDYFYLPARSEHRGTGGIFFDDMEADEEGVLDFVQAVADAWMPSWLPIVEKRQPLDYTDEQKQWQKLRRGRYLEFNLLYDRGVKFGLQTANPRVEGVMVSAPPEIAFEYNHVVAEGSEEEKLMKILKNPIDWV